MEFQGHLTLMNANLSNEYTRLLSTPQTHLEGFIIINKIQLEPMETTVLDSILSSDKLLIANIPVSILAKLKPGYGVACGITINKDKTVLLEVINTFRLEDRTLAKYNSLQPCEILVASIVIKNSILSLSSIIYESRSESYSTELNLNKSNTIIKKETDEYVTTYETLKSYYQSFLKWKPSDLLDFFYQTNKIRKTISGYFSFNILRIYCIGIIQFKSEETIKEVDILSPKFLRMMEIENFKLHELFEVYDFIMLIRNQNSQCECLKIYSKASNSVLLTSLVYNKREKVKN